MSRAKLINGVAHRKGCACPLCDPGGSLMTRARDVSREQRRTWAAARVVPLPLPGDRLRRVQLPPFETEKTRRFRELLREGVSSRVAAQIIESELKGTP